MKLLHISLFVCLLLAVAVDGAKKRKNNHRDRDEVSSRQQTEDEQPSARKDDERQKETGGRRKEKEEKEEKPLKKAEDESSSEEEDEKKKENKTTVAPSRKRREYERQPMTVYTDVDLIDENRRFLNGGEKTEIGKDETAKRPDYRKNSRTRRTLERHRRNHAVVSSEEDTLKKAEELNGGEQRPVDKQPSQSQMPEKVKAHKHRAARHLIAKSQPGNVVTSREEEETEEWKLENEEDYDDGGNY
ncbi:hypothetical protein PENTCL1PPCAC_28785 [Pristionchus entomophagus]|uniref:Uncharacterized protein n=1 Tax=Pristionchus entomophagus TaxID=358040 RepID=A0AAV5UHR8_9BILA|nr:hypothetical protein PENTCL1PPCAC_28785 [Pristionchus entomophagus]